MHSYAREDPDRRAVQLWLVVGSVLVVLLSAPPVASFPIPSDLKVVIAPTPLLLYGLVFALFDRLLWRVRIRGIGVSSIPDLNGAWVGVISSNLGATSSTAKNYPAVITTRQSWSSVQIKLHTSFSTSTSVMAVMSGQREEATLRYEYQARPDDAELHAPLISEHNGVAAITLQEDDGGRVLNGSYYTDSRMGQHTGKLHDFHRLTRRRKDYLAITSNAKLSQDMNRLIEKCATTRHLQVEGL